MKRPAGKEGPAEKPVGELGKASRVNPDVRRPWNLNENVSLGKSVRASTSMRVEIRVEAFNIFNRVVWDAPNTDFSSNSFGVVSRQFNTPRQMQLGLKVYW